MCKKYTLCIAVIIALCGMLCSLYADWGWEQNDYRLTYNKINRTLTYSNAWSIAVSIPSSQHYLHVVWAHDSLVGATHHRQIRYRRNTNYGNTASWQLEKKISGNVGDCEESSVAAAGTFVHVAWHTVFDYDIYYNRSTDSGANWNSIPDTLYDKDWKSMYPSIATSGPYVHVVWYNDRRPSGGIEIAYIRSTDYGQSWKKVKWLGYTDDSPGSNPSIATSGSYVHVVWNLNEEIVYQRSTDNGDHWYETLRYLTTENDTASVFPSVTAYESYVHVTWQEGIYSSPNAVYEIFHMRSVDNGDTFSLGRQISDNESYSPGFPSIAGSDHHVYVMWRDYRDANPPTTTNYEIYYNFSSNDGLNWLRSDEPLTNNDDKTSDRPSVATLDTFAYVVWTDTRDNDSSEIYFQRRFRQDRGNRGGGSNILNALATSPGVKFGGRVMSISPITFRIYDVAGREVSSFVHRPVSTEFSYVWKPENLASGVYFVHASQKDGYQAKAKVVWVK